MLASGLARSQRTLAGIRREVVHHVFVNFLLQVDSQSAVGTKDFVVADTGVRGHVTAGIRNVHIVEM